MDGFGNVNFTSDLDYSGLVQWQSRKPDWWGAKHERERVRIGREGLWYVYRHPFEEFGCKRRAQVVAPGGMVVES